MDLPQTDRAQRVVLRALHFDPALLPHGARQPFAPRVIGLECQRSDARSFVLLPMAPLASLAAVVGDLALRATAQRKQRNKSTNSTLCGAQFLALAGLLWLSIAGAQGMNAHLIAVIDRAKPAHHETAEGRTLVLCVVVRPLLVGLLPGYPSCRSLVQVQVGPPRRTAQTTIARRTGSASMPKMRRLTSSPPQTIIRARRPASGQP